MTFESMLTGSATLLRPTQGPATDALNRPVASYAQAGVAKCRGQKDRATEVVTEAGKTEVADWLFFFLPGCPIQRMWHFVYNGATYRALSVDSPTGRGNAAHHKEVMARIVG